MAFAPRTPFDWHLRTRVPSLGQRTLIMGVLNVTPDSFSDGGLHFTPDAALRRALTVLDEGADILDIGGESTRPNATPITPEEEQFRTLPVIEAILKARPKAVLSIDTFHASTAKAAVEAGAEIVNDVSGHAWDPAMSSTCAALKCGVVLMHTRGRPQDWPTLPPLLPAAVLPVVLTGLRDSLHAARTAGIANDHIILDPGFGFGKIGDENYALHALLSELHQFGLPLLTGTSRKRFLAKTLAPFHHGQLAPMNARLNAITASNIAAILAGAHIIRVHDVRPAAEAAAIADAILNATSVLANGSNPNFASIPSNTPQ